MAQPVHKARFFLADAGVDLALGDLLRRLALNALRLLALPCQLREPVQIAPDRRGVVLGALLRALLRHVPEALLRSPLELRDEVQQFILRLALADGKLRAARLAVRIMQLMSENAVAIDVPFDVVQNTFVENDCSILRLYTRNIEVEYSVDDPLDHVLVVPSVRGYVDILRVEHLRSFLAAAFHKLPIIA